jgi:peptide chain release factor 1
MTDHRINLTLYKLDLIMQGDVEELFDALKLSAKEELLGTKTETRTESSSNTAAGTVKPKAPAPEPVE